MTAGTAAGLAAALQWLAGLPPAALLRDSTWAYPFVEILHIVGFVVLAGSIFVVDLRLVGVGRVVPMDALLRFVLPWTIGSTAVVVPTGTLLFMAHAPELATNLALQVKLALLVLALLNAASFHHAMRTGRVLHARWAGATSMVLWLGVIAAGRLIAYV